MKGGAVVIRKCLWFSLFLLQVVLLFSIVAAPQADAARKDRGLLIGIEPEHNIFDQVQQYRILAGFLSEQLGTEVTLTIMSRYGEVVNRFRSLRLDGAILSSYTATLAISELGLQPVATLVGQDGKSSSHGYIFTRKDSGIASAADMRGKSVVFVDPATTEGYLFARSFFRQHDIQDMDSFFSRQYFSGSHASSLFAVLDGRADVGSAKESVFEQLVSKDRSIRHELQIIAKSPPVPGVTLCMKDDLDPGILEKLRGALFAMDHTVEGHKVLKQLGASRFAPASPEDFAVVSTMAESAGVNMTGDGRN